MTVETFAPSPIYLIAGTGPYTITHPYQAGSLTVSVIVAGVKTTLTSLDATIDPVASAATGTVTLSPAAAAAFAGQQLLIERQTVAEQGWAGATAREKGLEAQLDQLTQIAQDNAARTTAAIRISTPVGPIVPVPNGIIGFDANGEPIVTVGEVGGIPVSTFGNQLITAATASGARVVLGLPSDMAALNMLGGNARTVTDWNAVHDLGSGFYAGAGTALNAPEAVLLSGVYVKIGSTAGILTVAGTVPGASSFRRAFSGGIWGPWERIGGFVSGVTDWNAVTAAGLYVDFTAGTAANAPGLFGVRVLVWPDNAGNLTQMAFRRGTTEVWTRTQSAGIWTAWERLVTATTLPGLLNATGAAPLYALRAWCKFDAAGAVIASGNVAGVTRNSAGNYTVTLLAAMPSANYAVTAISENSGFEGFYRLNGAPSAGAFTLLCQDKSGTPVDRITRVMVAGG